MKYVETLTEMTGTTQGASDYYAWHVPGAPVAVQIHLDVIDRILAEAMRGFGAVPKRGAEVGGLLLGTVEHGETTIVRIDDFEPVACDYKRGPSYLFTEGDRAGFDTALARWQPDGSRPTYAVGFYRSHTREGMSLSPEDTGLLDEKFPSPVHIALLVKPYGTKVSTAGFFFREAGKFQDTTPLEFPFRRRELTGEEAPSRRPLAERHPPEPASFTEIPPPKSRRSAMWMPLSLICLLFGIALGLMIGFARGTGPALGAGDFSLGLAVSKSGDNLSVKWDRQAPAIRAARRGSLEIEDGGYTKIVDLDAATLRNGTITVQNPSHTVRFQLTVYPGARVTVTETMEWKQ